MEPLLSLPGRPNSIFLIAPLALLGHLIGWFLISIYKKRADLADIAWGLGFFLISWISFLLAPFSWKSLLVNLMVTFWAFRLSVYIFLRNRNREEDFRYREMKNSWGANFRLRLFSQVFLLQGAILYVVALPLLWINTHPETLEWTTLAVASLFWLLAFSVEAMADWQLYRFQQNRSNRGKLLTTGFWGFVRHPNYLGEIIQWWVFWALSANLPLIISPLLISFLIIKVSGIAPLEKKWESRPDFRAYKQKTPCLIPISWMNGGLYTIGWLFMVHFGPTHRPIIPFLFAILILGLQFYIFSRTDRNSMILSPLLCLYALILGILQESIFIHSDLVQYPIGGGFPPLYLISLYPLFAQTLNSSFQFINRNLYLGFFLGGFGAVISYFSAQKLGAVKIISPLSYPPIFLSWALFLTALLILNRKIYQLKVRYSDPDLMENGLTVFFDEKCPVCSAEKKKLQERKQTGKVIYDCLGSEESFQKKKVPISYEAAQKKIQAIDSKGQIFTGIDALSEIYARTDFLSVAIFLQAPGFRPFFILAYGCWARLRKYLPSPKI